MILYHITQDLDHNGFFYPDIPIAILPEENQVIPRVCTSISIEGCLGSFPGGGARLEETMGEKGDIFKVFRIDTEKLGITNVLNSLEIAENRYVFDAMLSGECWILEQFMVPTAATFYIKIEGYDENEIAYENFQYFETRDSLGLTDEEFVDSDDFDPDDHANYYTSIFRLDYSIIHRDDLGVEIGMMREEYGIELS